MCTQYLFDAQGEVAESKPVAGDTGTAVTVSQIFQERPVRRKRAVSRRRAEVASVKTLLQAYAVARPDVRLSLANRTRGKQAALTWHKKATSTCSKAVALAFGQNLASNLVSVSGRAQLEDGEEVAFDGLVPRLKADIGAASAAKLDRARCLHFVNGRWVFLRPLAALARDACAPAVEGRHPWMYMNLSIPQAFVDVNLSPDKKEVLIDHEDAVLAMVRQALDQLYNSESSQRDATSDPVDVVDGSAPAPPNVPSITGTERNGHADEATASEACDVNTCPPAPIADAAIPQAAVAEHDSPTRSSNSAGSLQAADGALPVEPTEPTPVTVASVRDWSRGAVAVAPPVTVHVPGPSNVRLREAGAKRKPPQEVPPSILTKSRRSTRAAESPSPDRAQLRSRQPRLSFTRANAGRTQAMPTKVVAPFSLGCCRGQTAAQESLGCPGDRAGGNLIVVGCLGPSYEGGWLAYQGASGQRHAGDIWAVNPHRARELLEFDHLMKHSRLSRERLEEPIEVTPSQVTSHARTLK